MGETWKNAKPHLEGVVKPLTETVDSLTSDTGWHGEAATRFRATWSQDALTAGAFSDLVASAGEILGTLADHLSAAETALKNAEDVAARAGIPMTAKGVPATFTVSDPPSASDNAKVSALREYDAVRQEVLQVAQRARLDAADRLRRLYAAITDIPAGDGITLGDYLRGLYSAAADKAGRHGTAARALLDDAEKAETDAKKALRAERKALKAEGRPFPKDWAAKTAYRDAVAEVESLKGEIALAERHTTTLPFDAALSTSVKDAASALRLGEGLYKVPDFLKDLPVVDVAAAGACGILEARQDHEKGWSWTHALVVDEGANVGGLAAGSAITGGILAAFAADPPALAVAGVGGLVAIGATGLIDHSLHENWSEDIHDHGVVGGILHGVDQVASQTGDDYLRLGKEVWHGITSLF
nr:hypothetical protein [Streptomyces sp. SID5468]